MLPDDQSQTFEISTHGQTSRVVGPGYMLGGVYLLKAKLGQGGMGCVFSAEHQLLKKDVAVKFISVEQVNPESWRRFELEGRTIGKMEHPAIVKIYDMAISDECPFYAMDLLEGIPLYELHERRAVSSTAIFEIFKSLAEGFAYAHGKGVIHRDIKPSNVMLVPTNGRLNPKILDFGIAKLTDKSTAQSQSQTKTGLIVGSPLYMSPEQAQGEICDERSDIYSLGCTLFEVLIGQPPFKGASAMQTMMMHQEAPVPRVDVDVQGRKLPIGTNKLIAKMLAKNKSQRYQSMSQVAHDLERLIAGRPVGSTPQTPDAQAESTEGLSALSGGGASKWMVPAAALLCLLGCGAIGFYFLSKQQKQTAPLTVATTNKKSTESIDYAPALPEEGNVRGANYYKGLSIQPQEELHPLQSKELKSLMAVKEIPVQRNYRGVPQAIAIQFPNVEIGRIGDAAKAVAARGLIITTMARPIGFIMYMPEHAAAIFYPHVLALIPKDIISDMSLSDAKESLLVKSRLDEKDQILLPEKFAAILKIAVTWKNLQRLSIENMSLKNIDLAAILAPAKALGMLELRTLTNVPDDSLAKCPALKTLFALVVIGTTEVPKTISAVAGNGHLLRINLNGSKLTPEIADALARSSTLQTLELNERFDVNCTIIERLGASKSLKKLIIFDAPLRPQTIADLAKVRKSWQLFVRKDPCNEDAVTKLAAQGVQFMEGD